jgi:hypothetical protein
MKSKPFSRSEIERTRHEASLPSIPQAQSRIRKDLDSPRSDRDWAQGNTHGKGRRLTVTTRADAEQDPSTPGADAGEACCRGGQARRVPSALTPRRRGRISSSARCAGPVGGGGLFVARRRVEPAGRACHIPEKHAVFCRPAPGSRARLAEKLYVAFYRPWGRLPNSAQAAVSGGSGQRGETTRCL